jgi:hypothetical protein
MTSGREGTAVAMTKLGAVLDIVNWEHRYIHGHLMGGNWVIERVRELMKLKTADVHKKHRRLFEIERRESREEKPE